MLTVACVWIGAKYGPEYVVRLRSMVARHLGVPHEFICLSDNATKLSCVRMIDVRHLKLPTWFNKMALFNPEIRGASRTIYLDLDTVIVRDLTPLAQWDGTFGICENFTRLVGNATWPCRYGSCVMSFAPDFGRPVFDGFMSDRNGLIREAQHYGDQYVIERLSPYASFLQDELPPGFFLNKRDLPKHPDSPPAGASIVVFGGSERPHNCKTEWIKAAWN